MTDKEIEALMTVEHMGTQLPQVWFRRADVLRIVKAALATNAKCQTCNDNGVIGGPSYSDPGEGGEPCPDCTLPAPTARMIDAARAVVAQFDAHEARCGPVRDRFKHPSTGLMVDNAVTIDVVKLRTLSAALN